MTLDEIPVTDTFKLEVYDNLYDLFPHFDAVGYDHQQIILSRLSPDAVYQSHNVPMQNYLDSLVTYVSGGTPTQFEATHIAYGDGTSSPSPSDDQGSPNDALENELKRYSLANVTANGDTLVADHTLGGAQLNGNNISEAGLVDDNNGQFINRALVGPRLKKDGQAIVTTANIDYGGP